MATTTDGRGTNDTRFNDLLVKCAALGKAKGTGDESLSQFYILTANASYDGIVDVVKDKHGPLMDDAVKAYEAYDRARNDAAIFNHKTPSGKVQAAKLRSMIKLGGWTRGGAGEPIATMNKLITHFENARKKPGEREKLDDLTNVLLKFARTQVKQVSLIEGEDLRAFCFKAPKVSKTLEDYLNDTAKRLEDLRLGKAANGTLQHSSDRITHVLVNIRAEVQALRTGEIEAASEDASLEDADA